MATSVSLTCAECDAEIKAEGISAGYATMRDDGRKICYDCAAWHERTDMIKDGRAVLYFDETKRSVTNWTGKLVFDVRSVSTTKTRQYMSRLGGYRRLIDVWIYFDGSWWYGRNGNADWQQCVHFRRLKAKKANQLSRSYWLGW